MRKLVASFALALLCSGCASTVMGGSVPYHGQPKEVLGKYRVPTCTLVANGNETPGPVETTYYLASTPKGLVLYELDVRNEGVAITNHWKDEKGDHFLNWVKMNNGWEFILPADRTQDGERLVFTKGKYHAEETDGVLKLTSGEPVYRCRMIPFK